MKKLKSILVALSILVASNSIAQSNEPKVNYIGQDKNYLLFRVYVPDEVLLSVTDTNEGELYSSLVKKSFKVKVEKKEGQSLNFRMVCGEAVYVRYFDSKLIERL